MTELRTMIAARERVNEMFDDDSDPVWTAWAMRVLLIVVLAFWAGAIWQAIERAPVRPADCAQMTAGDCAALMGDRHAF